jgi:hypothetical protein
MRKGRRKQVKRDSTLATLAIVSSVWLAFLGCTSTDRKASAADPDHIIEYKHGAKLLVQYIPSKNETTVYQHIPANDRDHKEPPLRPDLVVGGQTIKGKHSFELFDMVGFQGRKPLTVPTNTSLSITHAITSRKEWHFPAKAKLSIVVDRKSFDVPVYSQTELKKDDPSDAEFYEVLITKPTYEMYAKMADAREVKVQIGSASFNLDSESIASYRDFVGYLTPGTK